MRTSEDKVRRKDLCWSVRAVYILQKLSDVSGPGLGEAGRYKTHTLGATTLLLTNVIKVFRLHLELYGLNKQKGRNALTPFHT